MSKSPIGDPSLQTSEHVELGALDNVFNIKKNRTI